MSAEGRQSDSLYPACYTCHSKFTAEEGLTVEKSIKICSECHNPVEVKFHSKVYEKKLSCLLCHSDWTGRNTSVRLVFLTTSEMCLECHTRRGVGTYTLSEMHRLHSKITDCSSCHSTYVLTHEQFFTAIIATPSTTCTTCHSVLGLHGLHFERKPGIKCVSCHVKGVGALSFKTKLEPLKACINCHKSSNTTLHDLVVQENLQYYHCLKCHSEWIDKQPYRYTTITQICNTCHPSSFTSDRSYGLHRVHLTSTNTIMCSDCHSQVAGKISHNQWFESALNQTRCLECHSMSHLMVTHKEFFLKTTSCFTSSCHAENLWKWPTPRKP